jgi:hypothetical protein
MFYAALKRVPAVASRIGDEWCEAATQLYFLDFANSAISESIDETMSSGIHHLTVFPPICPSIDCADTAAPEASTTISNGRFSPFMVFSSLACTQFVRGGC